MRFLLGNTAYCRVFICVVIFLAAA